MVHNPGYDFNDENLIVACSCKRTLLSNAFCRGATVAPIYRVRADPTVWDLFGKRVVSQSLDAAVSTAHAHGPMRLTDLGGQLDRVVSLRLTKALAGHGRTLPQFTALMVLSARGR